MSKSIESLEKYLKSYYLQLDIAVKFNSPQSEIDVILDRINEIKEMIDELKKGSK